MARPTMYLVLATLFLAASGPAARAETGPAPGDSVAAAWVLEARQLHVARRHAATDSVAALAVERLASRPGADSSLLAQALLLRGWSRYQRQMYSDSLAPVFFVAGLRIYGRMARADTVDWIKSMDTFAWLLLARMQPDSAQRVLAGARKLCSPSLAGSDTLLATLWLTTGSAHRRRDQYDLAIAAYDSCRALRVRRFGPDHPKVAEPLAETGAVQVRMNRLEEAIRMLETAIAILERGAPESPRLPPALAELASAQFRGGDIARSIETIERQISVYVALGGPNTPFMIPPLYNIGLRLHEFGDYAGARAVFAGLLPRAEASFGPGNDRTENVRAMAGVSAMLAGDTAAAARDLGRARDWLRSRPLDTAHMANQIEVYQSMLLARRGDLAGARHVVTEGLQRERSSARPAGVVLLLLLDQLASVQMAGRDSLGLDSTLAEMEARFGDPLRAEGMLHGNYLRARARGEHWLGRREPAMRYALACEQAERERLQHNARALPDERALQLSTQLGEGLDLLVQLSRDGREEDIAVAWDRVVRWRGLVTAELAWRRAPHAAAGDTALAAAHARWVAALRRSARIEVAGTASATELATSRSEAGNEERRYVALAAERGVPRDTLEASLAGVRARLAPQQALVSIVGEAAGTDSARYVAFATLGPAGALQRIDLGPAGEVAERLGAWRAALSRPPVAGRERREERACRSLGAIVRAGTWDRWASRLAGAKTVVLVADGDLAEVPWHALPDGESRYLVETGIEIRTPGAERELLASPAPDGRGLLALGDPDFGLSAPGAPAPGAGVSRGTSAPDTATASAVIARSLGLGCDSPPPIVLAPLPGAREEVDDIVRAWGSARPGEPVARLVGAAGTEQAFLSAAPGRAVLHLATHGILWSDSCAPVFAEAGTRGVGGVNPLPAAGAAKGDRPQAAATGPVAAGSAPATGPSPWSGRRVWLALAGANGAHAGAADANDGLLTADEVVTLDLSGAEWVVLSACQSGVGQHWPLEGSAGMRRAFRLAGAHAVIASQWAIADEATRDWMHALYAARTGSARSVGSAMGVASRQVLEARRRAGRDTHPFYWAAFTATGD